MSHERKTPPPSGTGDGAESNHAPEGCHPGDPLQAELPDDGNTIPPHIFPVPNSHVSYDLAGTHIFTILGRFKEVFRRSGTVNEVVFDETGDSLRPVTPERFVSLIETYSARIAKLEINEGTRRWRSSLMPLAAANVLLKSDSAKWLPRIGTILAAPVIARAGHEPPRFQRLGPGYHPGVGGGIYITECDAAPVVPLDVAVPKLLDLLADFDFASPADASRAMASIISPALKIGGWIDDDFPLDVAEADHSQSGKTYRQNLVCTIYREEPSRITAHNGGVGSLNESVAACLIAGRPFIQMDNIRGRIDSPLLETAIRGSDIVRCRALRTEIEVDTRPYLWQLSTNGAELTRDLANRSIITRIRKRENHEFRTFPEGDLRAHVRANQPFYLGCVHSVVAEWWGHGGPSTNEARHDFRKWCRVLDWIVQHVFSLPPLLDGHREEQLRTANPRLQWLRDVIVSMKIKPGDEPVAATASELADIAEENSIDFPGPAKSSKAPSMVVGSIMGSIFRDAGQDAVFVDQHEVSRQTDYAYDPQRKEHRERKLYVISRL